MQRTPILIGLALLWAFSGAPAAWSHPHVFVHTAVDGVFDDKGLAGFRIRWVFDEMFSSMIIMEFDVNGDRVFDPDEVEAVKRGAFDNLEAFDWFVHIHVNDQPFEVAFVTDFSAEIQGDRMTYAFFVPCHVKATSSDKQVRLSVYDPEFYCSTFLVEDPLFIEEGDAYHVSYRVAKNPEQAYYFGQIAPEEIRMRFRRRE